MNVTFLDGLSLEVKDYAFLSEDFEIIIDSVVPQKSSLVINKVNINAEVGDLLIIKNELLTFVGSITTIERSDEFTTSIQAYDFVSKFDIKVPVTSLGYGNVGDYILNIIKNTFYNTSDRHKKLAYLLFQNKTSKYGSLTFDSDTLKSIVDLNETIMKEFSVRLAYELIYDDGQISKIKIKAIDVTKGLSIRYNLGALSDLVINDTDEESINEIIYVPKAENTSYRTTISYVRLNDGTIGTNPLVENRPSKAYFKYETYSDNDYPNLASKAKESLLDSSLDHNITFNITIGNSTIAPYRDFEVGDFVSFVSESKTYDTLVTRLSFKNSFVIASVTLGEHRIKLTEKMKLLNRRNE